MLFFVFFFNLFILISSKYIQPKLSIIIPIYNVNKYLKECLESIINQTLKNIEIICVNDGSTDNSLEIIMQFSYDNRIIIINKINTGYGDSMNNGFDFVTGKYIGIVESDDFIDINMFKNLYKYTKKGNVDIIRCNFYLYWEKNKKHILYFQIIKELYNKIFNPIENNNIFFIQPSIWSGIYKKEFLIKNNIKFLQTPGASYQDTSFFYKTLFKSKNVFYTNKAFYYYRQSNLNSSINNNTFKKALFIHKELFEIEKYIKKDLKLYEKNKICFNTKKMLTLLWNFYRVDKKKDYIKILYQEIYEILKNNSYYYEQFTYFENRLFKYLIDYGYEVAFDIFINMKNINKKNPKISIIMPIYNSEKFIYECMNSLIHQTFKNFEVICINDGSIDNSLKILKNFEKSDNRIHIITQKNMGQGIARNVGMKASIGDYLIFLDSDDIFEDTMLEELYAKIKGYDAEIVICNSKNFKTINGNEKKFFNKKYSIFDDILMNKTFKSLDIKKDFFNLFIWWPWDKLFKAQYIKNLGIEYQKLRSSEDLYFIASAVITAKKISFLDKILINHRIGINTSVENSREKSWDNFYCALKKLKDFIKEKGLYKRFKQDFINYVVGFSLWNLETISGNSFCFMYNKLKNEWFKEFGITKYNKRYFYNKNIYNKLKYILKSDLEHIEIPNNQNNFNLNYLKKKKIQCLHKDFIPFYKTEYNIKLKILYIIYINIKKLNFSFIYFIF